MYQEILFTHDDLDGAGCRVVFDVAHKLLGRDETYTVLNCTNANIDSKVMEYYSNGRIGHETEVFFGDICASRETLQFLQQDAGCAVNVYDHHRTNFFAEHVITAPGECKIVPEDLMGVQQSGTVILYQGLCRKAYQPDSDRYQILKEESITPYLDYFMDTVRSYDTYEWKETDNLMAKRLQILFQLLGMERFCKMYTDRFIGDKYDLPLITPECDIFIDAKLESEQSIIDAFTVDDAIVTSVKGHLTALVMKSVYANVSELANQFLMKNPDIELFVYVSLAENGTLNFRTVRDNFDTGADIAKPLGGGGHPKASGAPFNDDLKMVLTNIMIHYLNGYEIKDITWED